MDETTAYNKFEESYKNNDYAAAAQIINDCPALSQRIPAQQISKVLKEICDKHVPECLDKAGFKIENLIGKKVSIELQGGKQTILYDGIYQGTTEINSHSLIVLKNSDYYNRAGMAEPREEKSSLHRTKSRISLVSLEKMIGLNVEPEWSE